MAEQKFTKGSEEWVMFNDFWKMCQSFWMPEDNDTYWQKLHDAAQEFGKHSRFARFLALGFISEMEQKLKDSKK